MARKVFISVLGFTNYGYCFYVKDNYKSSSVRFIQEATLDYLCQQEEWTKSDVAYFLLTDGAENANWVDNGHKDRNTGLPIRCEGLCSRLKQMNLPFEICTIRNLPNGNNEEEIWKIFERVYEKIQEGDELYFDLTHGFRYLPMLVLVLGNYSKFLKDVTVKSITYGNYEAREENNAPIIDLLPLSALQDWTYAAGQFIESGNVKRLQYLCNKELKPILKEAKGSDPDATNLKTFINTLGDVIDERQTCRGMSIIKSESFRKLKKVSDKLETTKIDPLNPVFDKIKKSMESFDENENIKNAFSAAVWCYQNGLLQQAATILQEFVITFVCSRQGIQIDDESKRDWVTSAFSIRIKNILEKDWRLGDNLEQAEIKRNGIKQILKDELFDNSAFVKAFGKLSEVRNDYNHSGMRLKRSKPKKIKEDMEECINIFGVILFNVKPNISC